LKKFEDVEAFSGTATPAWFTPENRAAYPSAKTA
jgi:hypothetical protein